MKRRRVIIGLVMLVVVAWAAFVFWPRGPRPCLATFQSVREGMTREEVVAIVGGPPETFPDPSIQRKLGLTVLVDEWRADDGRLRVYYAKDGRADWVQALEMPGPPTDWDRFRDRFR
jgi:hypothetical protein